MASCASCGAEDLRDVALFCDQCGDQFDGQIQHEPQTTLPVGSAKLNAASLGLLDQRPASAPKREAGPIQEPPSWARGAGWEVWLKAGPMAPRVRVDGDPWDCVANIDARNRAAEDKHKFKIESAKLFRERVTHRYPGGSGLESKGYSHIGGCASFQLDNLVTGAPLAIVRQVPIETTEALELRVNGQVVATVSYDEVDERSPWRNRTFVVPGELVRAQTLLLEVEDLGSEKGLNWYHVWCYQPSDAVPAGPATLVDTAKIRAKHGAGADPEETISRQALVDLASWDETQGSGIDFPAMLRVGDEHWKLVDTLLCGDADDIDVHGFTIADAQGSLVSFRLGLEYPDGTAMQDTGVRFDHGEASWTVGNLDPERELVMLFRTDVYRGNWHFDLSADGQPVGGVRVDIRDTEQRARNFLVRVPADALSGDAIRLAARVGQDGRGVTFFRMWFYQRL